MEQSKKYYQNEGGRLVCYQHARGRLQSELLQRPSARVIETPSAVWERLTREEASTIEAEFVFVCEVCRGEAEWTAR